MPSFLTPDFGLIFWLLLAFSVLFFVLAKFGFPAIIKMVEERKEFIDESLLKAKEANERLAQIQVESESILKEAREQQAQILKEAMATKESIVAEAKVKAEREGEKLLQDAKNQIALEKENALRDIRSQVAELSVLIAEKVIRKELQNSSEQAAMIERLLDEVETNK